MNIAKNPSLVLAKKVALFLIIAIIVVLFASGNAFATTSIKYGWVALDSNKKPVLQGSQYTLSGSVKPIKYISNGAGNPIAVNNKSVVYLSNNKTGTAQALILGDKIVSGYKDAFITTFTIANAIDMSKTSVSNISDQSYTGKQIKPKVTVKYGNTTLKENTDYKLDYGNNVKLNSTGTVIIKGIGAYSGQVVRSFKIGKVKISDVTVAKIKARYCNGLKAVKPALSITWQGKKLVKDKDYKVKYSSCTKPGTAKATITGIGDYKGQRVEKYTLVNVGDIVAKAGCKMAYSRTCTKKGTKLYKKHWRGHHDCGGGMWTIYSSYTGYYKNLWHRGKKNWTYICKYNSSKDPIKCGMLPGDILVRDSNGFHALMYVGSSIPQEIYKKNIKGKGVANGDLGEPKKNAIFISSHHSYPSKYGAPLCICNKKWAGTGWGTYKVYRIKSDNAKWQVGKVVK